MAKWCAAKAPSFRSASIRGWVLAWADSALMELYLNPERFSRLRLYLVSSFGVAAGGPAADHHYSSVVHASLTATATD
jgi:hypothetical protein